MNIKNTIKRISHILSLVPMAHDGMGKTASARGALSYNADMRIINDLLGNLALDCDELSIKEIDKRLKEIETVAKKLKSKALAPD